MLIIGLLDVVSSILLWIVGFVPDEYPSSLDTAVTTLTDAISNGIGILLFYFDTNVLSVLLSFVLDFIMIYYVVRLIRYIISVIPIFNMHADN